MSILEDNIRRYNSTPPERHRYTLKDSNFEALLEQLKTLREQTKIQENTLDEQKRQSDIMEIWGKMMEKQTE